jgi:hypothetical protein
MGDNIGIDARETGWEVMDRVHLAQDREQCCEHGNETSGSIKGGKFLD